MGSLVETDSSNKLDVFQVGDGFSLITPIGIGFVIANPY